MTNIKELLKEADPLRHESALSTSHCESLRRQIQAAVREAPSLARRRLRSRLPILVAVAAALVTASFLGLRVWSPFVGSLQAAVRFEVRLAEDGPAPGLHEVSGSNRTVYIRDEEIITNSDIAGAAVVQGRTPSRFGVEVKFNAAGTEKMVAATKNHIGKPLAILVDGRLVAAPVLRSVIRDSAVVSGDFTKAQAERIVNGIR